MHVDTTAFATATTWDDLKPGDLVRFDHGNAALGFKVQDADCKEGVLVLSTATSDPVPYLVRRENLGDIFFRPQGQFRAMPLARAGVDRPYLTPIETSTVGAPNGSLVFGPNGPGVFVFSKPSEKAIYSLGDGAASDGKGLLAVYHAWTLVHERGDKNEIVAIFKPKPAPSTSGIMSMEDFGAV